MRELNTLRYKENRFSIVVYNLFSFCRIFNLIESYKGSFFLHFCGQFLVRKSGQWSEISVQAVFFIFLDREKVVKWSEKVGKWSVFGQF